MDIQTDLILRSIKIIDICFLTTIFFLLGTFIARLIDKVVGDFDKEKEDKKHIIRVFAESIIFVSILGIIVYVSRNLVEKIPFPLNGLYGYNHLKVKELNGGVILPFSILYFQNYLRNKLTYLFNRLKA